VLAIWVGAALLRSDACVRLSERDRTAYGARPLWLATFDAASATCSVGLTLFDLREDYTPLGRWTLLALGVAGTLLHIAALCAALARVAGEPRQMRGVIPAAVCLAGAVLIGLFRPGVMDADGGSGAGLFHALSAFFGLGITTLPAGSDAAGPLLAATVLGMVGLGALVVTRPAQSRTLAVRWTLCAMLIGIGSGLALSLAAWGIHALEHPRGESGWRGHGTRDAIRQVRAEATARDRLLQVAVTSHAGWSPLPITDRAVGEGRKLTLALAIVVGGLGASAGGTFWFIIAACGGASLLGVETPGGSRFRLAAVRTLTAVLALTLATTLGLLIIEARVASRNETPATLGDAVLDAASVVGGAGLTSGLIENLTSAHLSKGMGQTVDSYLYATVWVMLAMFAGRTVPILVLTATGPPRGAAGERAPTRGG
jgi:Trk-type K+ transport system membrane component